MESNTKSIEGIEVYTASIIQTSVTTQDKDEQGYLVQTGANRGIACAITTTGDFLLYVTTNGDDILIGEMPDSIAVCIDLSDSNLQSPLSEREAVIQGAQRIASAAREISDIYDNDDAREEMEWYIEEARCAIRNAPEA